MVVESGKRNKLIYILGVFFSWYFTEKWIDYTKNTVLKIYKH